MRIGEISVRGHRSLRAIRFPVGGLTVFVGANGVGKINLYPLSRAGIAAGSGGGQARPRACVRRRRGIGAVGRQAERLAQAFADCGAVTPRTVVKRNGETWIEGLKLGGEFATTTKSECRLLTARMH